MATFEFDPKHRLRDVRCPCGMHANHIEHEKAQEHQSITAGAGRYERVVASALMRAILPGNAARRAFLQSVGASTALAALLQFFPL